MKEELIRVLNNKLDSINSDINSLKELNEKIDEENEQLSFVDSTIKVFDENGENNPLNFDKIIKEDFTRALDIAGDEVKNLFNSGACNYDGLVYLINGIKNGVSISLTNEQMNGIEYFIQTLTTKKGEITTKVGDLEQEKNNYPINDINELKTRKDKYEKIIDDIGKNKYVKDIDLLKEAIGFSQLSPSDTINVLSFVLEYNADLFKNSAPVHEEVKEEVQEEKEEPEEASKEEGKNEEPEETSKEEENKEELEETSKEEEPKEDKEEVEEHTESEEPKELEATEEVNESEPVEEAIDNGFHFNQVENDNVFDFPNITFGDEKKEEPEEASKEEENKEELEETPKEEETKEEVEEHTESEEPKELEPTEETDYQEFKPMEEVPLEEPVQPISFPSEDELPKEDIPVVEIPVPEVEDHENEVQEESIELPPIKEEEPSFGIPEPVVNPVSEEIPPVMDINFETSREEEPAIDNDFKDIINEKVDYETREKQEEEKTSTREMHKIFDKYGIEENVVLNELIDGDVKEYQNILDSLKEHGVLDYFKKNKELLIETLLYSGIDEISKVLRIIKEDLSVDDEDYEITLKIVINTIPSIFIREGGNYDNFVKNVDLFKRLEINLINLFDFSKEIFVADNEEIEKNLAIVNKYDFDVTYKNAKYFLLIPNIAEKLDYYIESVYPDKTKNETFDGINYIKNYAAKLNVVTDETIKRLRYSSNNGQKVFGNKPGSLAGEITNLRVHALAISDEYKRNFFNNEFANITPDEVREYIKLIHNSSNVGNYNDELDKLNAYHNGLRYVIDGINVSYNKVNRNYSVLRSYGIDSKKALQFAVCYNLVITKDEYNKLKDILDGIGGNV